MFGMKKADRQATPCPTCWLASLWDHRRGCHSRIGKLSASIARVFNPDGTSNSESDDNTKECDEMRMNICVLCRQ